MPHMCSCTTHHCSAPCPHLPFVMQARRKHTCAADTCNSPSTADSNPELHPIRAHQCLGSSSMPQATPLASCLPWRTPPQTLHPTNRGPSLSARYHRHLKLGLARRANAPRGCWLPIGPLLRSSCLGTSRPPAALAVVKDCRLAPASCVQHGCSQQVRPSTDAQADSSQSPGWGSSAGAERGLACMHVYACACTCTPTCVRPVFDHGRCWLHSHSAQQPLLLHPHRMIFLHSWHRGACLALPCGWCDPSTQAS